MMKILADDAAIYGGSGQHIQEGLGRGFPAYTGQLGNAPPDVDAFVTPRLSSHASSFAAAAGRRAEDDGRVTNMSHWLPPGTHGGIGGGVMRGMGGAEDATTTSMDATAAAAGASFPFTATPSNGAGLHSLDDFAPRQTPYAVHGQPPRPGQDGGDAGALLYNNILSGVTAASGSFPTAPQAAAPEHDPFQQPSAGVGAAAAAPIDLEMVIQMVQQITQLQQQRQMLSGQSYALPTMSMSHLQQPLATLNHTEQAYYPIPQQQQADAVQMQQQQAFGFGGFAQQQQNAAVGATAQQTLGSSFLPSQEQHQHQQHQQQQRDLFFQHLLTTGGLDTQQQQQQEAAAVVLPSANHGALPFSTAAFLAAADSHAPQPTAPGRVRRSRRGQVAAVGWGQAPTAMEQRAIAGGAQSAAAAAIAAAAPAPILDSASDSKLDDDDDDTLNSSATISSAAMSPRTPLDGQPSNGGSTKRRASKTTSSADDGKKKAKRRRVRPPETALQRLRRLERCQRLRNIHRQGREERHTQFRSSEERHARLTANLARLTEERTRLWALVLARRHSAT
jgi:hypothetical protein